MADNNVRDIAIDKNGSIWFATENGISVLTNSTAVENIQKSGSFQIKAFPNPFQNQTSIVFSLNSKSQVQINIYDLNGRHILALADKSLEAGEHRFIWSGLNTSGNKVLPGTYYVQFTINKQIQTHKILLVE